MKLPILYKYTSTGKVQQWEIEVSGNTYYTIEGLLEGKLTTSDPTICTGKNIGKSNETTAEQQAESEAKAKHQKKIDSGYNEVLSSEKKFLEPMLAFELSKYKDLLFTVPTFISPKLDGMRAILEDSKLISRKGKPILSCPHLEAPNLTLDGEIYSHELCDDFNQIMSLARQSKPTQADLDASALSLQYFVYDLPNSNKVYSERYKELCALSLPVGFRLVPAIQVFNFEELRLAHLKLIEDGYEGSMIRLDLKGYENKRSKQLLKYKEFQDAEFLILDVTPGLGNRSEAAGRLICKIDDETFGCSMTGTLDFMKEVLQRKEEVIGKMATVKFFELTEYGIPRFPTLKHIHQFTSKF